MFVKCVFRLFIEFIYLALFTFVIYTQLSIHVVSPADSFTKVVLNIFLFEAYFPRGPFAINLRSTCVAMCRASVFYIVKFLIQS